MGKPIIRIILVLTIVAYAFSQQLLIGKQKELISGQNELIQTLKIKSSDMEGAYYSCVEATQGCIFICVEGEDGIIPPTQGDNVLEGMEGQPIFRD